MIVNHFAVCVIIPSCVILEYRNYTVGAASFFFAKAFEHIWIYVALLFGPNHF